MSIEMVSGLGGRGAVARRGDRALQQRLEHLDRQQSFDLARLETAAQLEAARVEAVGYVGRRAMETVALVSQWEAQLGQLCPLAVTRLQGIADITALSAAQVVADAARKLG